MNSKLNKLIFIDTLPSYYIKLSTEIRNNSIKASKILLGINNNHNKKCCISYN